MTNVEVILIVLLMAVVAGFVIVVEQIRELTAAILRHGSDEESEAD